MELFKYTPIDIEQDIGKNKIEEIKNNLFWIPTVKSLNDPFDSKYQLSYPSNYNEMKEIVDLLNKDELDFLIKRLKVKDGKDKNSLL